MSKTLRPIDPETLKARQRIVARWFELLVYGSSRESAYRKAAIEFSIAASTVAKLAKNFEASGVVGLMLPTRLEKVRRNAARARREKRTT